MGDGVSAAAATYNEEFRGTLMRRMNMELVDIGAETTVARMPVEGNTQPYGLLHGGASAALVETVGSVAAAAHAGADRVAVGVEISCTHHRAVRSGMVTATARALHRGRTLATYSVEVRDDAGALVCSGRLTCVVRDRPPAEPKTMAS